MVDSHTASFTIRCYHSYPIFWIPDFGKRTEMTVCFRDASVWITTLPLLTQGISISLHEVVPSESDSVSLFSKLWRQTKIPGQSAKQIHESPTHHSSHNYISVSGNVRGRVEIRSVFNKLWVEDCFRVIDKLWSWDRVPPWLSLFPLLLTPHINMIHFSFLKNRY